MMDFVLTYLFIGLIIGYIVFVCVDTEMALGAVIIWPFVLGKIIWGSIKKTINEI